MLTRDKKGGIITKLSHEGQREKSEKTAWTAEFQRKPDLIATGLWNEAEQKSLKKLLTRSLRCDTINKSPHESESGSETAKDLEN